MISLKIDGKECARDVFISTFRMREKRIIKPVGLRYKRELVLYAEFRHFTFDDTIKIHIYNTNRMRVHSIKLKDHYKFDDRELIDIARSKMESIFSTEMSKKRLIYTAPKIDFLFTAAEKRIYMKLYNKFESLMYNLYNNKWINKAKCEQEIRDLIIYASEKYNLDLI